ncbi:hypothetical protein BH10PAT1_BH10PAT1_0580 [soil metagenome]
MAIPTAQQIAQNVAKTVANESNEVLKNAVEQIFANPEVQREKQKPAEAPVAPVEKPKDLSFLREYKTELDQIRRDNLFKELQKKITEGEEVLLESYVNELSYEQREVLKAQMEAVKIRKQASVVQQNQSLPQIISRKGRGMLNSFKKQNQQHVEMRQPPSS